jgi:hypothetical protein
MTEDEKKEVAAFMLIEYAIEARTDWVGIAEIIDVPKEEENQTVDDIIEYIKNATLNVTWEW